MAAFVAWAAALLVGPIIWKIVASLGIGLVAYVGLDALISQASAAILNNVGQLTGSLYQMAGLLGMMQAINIILSAMAVRASLAVVNKIKVG